MAVEMTDPHLTAAETFDPKQISLYLRTDMQQPQISDNLSRSNGPENGGVSVDNGGLRFNNGKPRFDLMPPEALIALADHYQKGAEKYADRNWERGMDWGKCFASMERHAWAWMSGEDIDPETGSHHMVAVAWNALALYVYDQRNIGVDDRPNCHPKSDV
jgi:hypothetical protein